MAYYSVVVISGDKLLFIRDQTFGCIIYLPMLITEKKLKNEEKIYEILVKKMHIEDEYELKETVKIGKTVYFICSIDKIKELPTISTRVDTVLINISETYGEIRHKDILYKDYYILAYIGKKY